jgi:hypothetical protein
LKSIPLNQWNQISHREKSYQHFGCIPIHPSQTKKRKKLHLILNLSSFGKNLTEKGKSARNAPPIALCLFFLRVNNSFATKKYALLSQKDLQFTPHSEYIAKENQAAFFLVYFNQDCPSLCFF